MKPEREPESRVSDETLQRLLDSSVLEHRMTRAMARSVVGELLALRKADALALTWEQKEAVAEEVLAVRKEQYNRSFDIECPECGRAPGSACVNFGSAGGPMNHTARIDAAAREATEPNDEFLWVGAWLLPEGYGDSYDHFTNTHMETMPGRSVAVYAKRSDLEACGKEWAGRVVATREATED